MTDPILASLELAAEKAGDITDLVYEQYFASCPGSEALMAHIDRGVRGKMIQEVTRLILVEDYKEEETYLNFEVKYHRTSFSVLSHMYANLLNAFHSVVKSSIQDDWCEEFDLAWKKRTGDLIREIEHRYPASEQALS